MRRAQVFQFTRNKKQYPKQLAFFRYKESKDHDWGYLGGPGIVSLEDAKEAPRDIATELIAVEDLLEVSWLLSTLPGHQSR